MMQEINLLPPQRRRLIRRESVMARLHGFLASLLWGVGLLTVAGIGSIVVLWLVTLAASDESAARLSDAIAEHRQLRDLTVEQNIVFQQVAEIGAMRIVWSDVIRQILVAVPPGVTVSSMSGTAVLEAGKTTAANLTMSGEAVTRSTFTVLENRLRDLEQVASVTGPTSNLLERTNAPYRLNLDLIPPDGR